MTRKTCMWLLTISNLVSCHPPHFQTFWTCYFLCLKWVFFFSGFHKLTPHPSGVSLNIIFSETHPWLHDEKKSLCYSSSLSSVHFLHNPSCTHVVLCSPEYYRHASFYCTSQMLCFFFYKLKVCGNSSLSKSISAIFPMASAHFVSLCHTLVILLIFQTFPYLLRWSVISDLWYYSCKKTTTHWRLRWWLEFFASKVLLN